MQTSDNMSTPRDVHFDDTLAATRGRSNYYFSLATWPIGVGTPRFSWPSIPLLYSWVHPPTAVSRSRVGDSASALSDGAWVLATPLVVWLAGVASCRPAGARFIRLQYFVGHLKLRTWIIAMTKTPFACQRVTLEKCNPYCHSFPADVRNKIRN